jgi:hypothetical protein
MAADTFHASDAAVVARYLQLRSLFQDRHLVRVEQLILNRYTIQTSRRIHSSLVAHVRTGFVLQGEGEMWPVVVMTTVDISVALCVELSPDRVAGLGTMINGPQRIRQRHWEDWYGWERHLGQLHPRFFDLDAAQQEEAVAVFYLEGLEWLATSGLLRRRSDR